MFQDDAADAKPSGSANSGSQEVVNCKFVVGCDGARSWVRKSVYAGFWAFGYSGADARLGTRMIGFELIGEPANYYVSPLTTFIPLAAAEWASSQVGSD